MNILKTLAVASIWLWIAPVSAYAPISPKTPITGVQSIETMISQSAKKWGVSEAKLKETLVCESSLNPNAIGELGEVGIAQIYLKYHAEISREQALNPKWSIDWMAKQMSLGHASWWTCSKKLGPYPS